MKHLRTKFNDSQLHQFQSDQCVNCAGSLGELSNNSSSETSTAAASSSEDADRESCIEACKYILKLDENVADNLTALKLGFCGTCSHHVRTAYHSLRAFDSLACDTSYLYAVLKKSSQGGNEGDRLTKTPVSTSTAERTASTSEGSSGESQLVLANTENNSINTNSKAEDQDLTTGTGKRSLVIAVQFQHPQDPSITEEQANCNQLIIQRIQGLLSHNGRRKEPGVVAQIKLLKQLCSKYRNGIITGPEMFSNMERILPLGGSSPICKTEARTEAVTSQISLVLCASKSSDRPEIGHSSASLLQQQQDVQFKSLEIKSEVKANTDDCCTHSVCDTFGSPVAIEKCQANLSIFDEPILKRRRLSKISSTDNDPVSVSSEEENNIALVTNSEDKEVKNEVNKNPIISSAKEDFLEIESQKLIVPVPTVPGQSESKIHNDAIKTQEDTNKLKVIVSTLISTLEVELKQVQHCVIVLTSLDALMNSNNNIILPTILDNVTGLLDNLTLHSNKLFLKLDESITSIRLLNSKELNGGPNMKSFSTTVLPVNTLANYFKILIQVEIYLNQPDFRRFWSVLGISKFRLTRLIRHFVSLGNNGNARESYFINISNFFQLLHKNNAAQDSQDQESNQESQDLIVKQSVTAWDQIRSFDYPIDVFAVYLDHSCVGINGFQNQLKNILTAKKKRDVIVLE